MVSTAPTPDATSRSRRRAFLLPREHGAWGMLLVPLATGAAAGNPHGERFIGILIFAAAALGLFFLRTPLEAWLGMSPMHPQNGAERRLIYLSITVYASVAALALGALIFSAHAYGLLLLGAAAAMVFLLQAVLRKLGRKTRMNSQLTGAIALSSTAAGAYYLAAGHFGYSAGVIWLANWLFAANQIHFVQLRIHSARALSLADKLRQGKGFLLHQVFTLLVLAWIWREGWFPGLVLLAFAPLFARGLAWFWVSPRPLLVHRLGVSELIYAVVFGMVFIVAFHLPLG